MLITLYKIGGVHFRLLGTNGFHVKAKNERFTAASSCCNQNLKYENLTSSFGRLRQNIAARLFFFIQPIKSLICGSAVDVAVVKDLKLPNTLNWRSVSYLRGDALLFRYFSPPRLHPLTALHWSDSIYQKACSKKTTRWSKTRLNYVDWTFQKPRVEGQNSQNCDGIFFSEWLYV